PAQGLYHHRNEHDACGMGFIVNLGGERSHDIVEKGIEILINLTHRGACGCDPETGDGAGILIQIPHEFFARRLPFALPERGTYGVGMMFLPVEPQQRLICEGIVERIAREEGLTVLGWRDTPINSEGIGRQARASQPYIEQVFLQASPSWTQDEFERKLYVTRRRAEAEVAQSDVHQRDFFYIPSMSSRTIVYKGLLLAPQIAKFYRELSDPQTRSAMCLVHQRFSTNTFPSWKLAHPYRFLCHNGEINTVRGNVNWMNARESVLASDQFGDDIEKIFPVIQPGGSDTASLDNAVEMLTLAGRSLPHVVAMLIPEAWDADSTMPPEKRAFYEFHASLMEPWDGPAAVAFTDGKWIGATLDRNGLRPARYLVTNDGHLILASETGVLPVATEEVKYKGRLQPGKMLLVNLEERRMVPDEEIKHALASRQPYGEWLAENQITLDALPEPPRVYGFVPETIITRQRAFGYTEEDLRLLLSPMANAGEEPIGSMGIDTPLACLSDRPQPLFNYFKQLFAQVTNPAIDPIREELLMSLTSYIGTERNILEETPKHCHTMKLAHPILTNLDLEKLRRVSWGDFLATTVSTVFRTKDGERGLERALESICRRASLAIRDGYRLLILSDRGIDEEHAPIPSLLALTAVHNHLVRERTRTQVALIVESGEPREVMHFALLIGYGASAVNPYLAIETLEDLAQRGRLGQVKFETALKHFKKAVNKGLLKIFSKMGISTLQSYRGAQCFEAIGLNQALVDRYFTGTASRIEGVGLDVLAREAAMKHEHAFRPVGESETELRLGGDYQFRVNGEHHLLNPLTVSKLQHAVRQKSFETFQEFTDLIDTQNREMFTLRGLMELRPAAQPIPLEEVEPENEIVKRFNTGAMSFGSISKEAHETLAIAMNRMGGRSNTGEGGEDEERFERDPNGDWRRSAIKMVSWGGGGFNRYYLVSYSFLRFI
ncbi:MAG: glutamate synthase central domain-containing protein, partial [Bryobacteraceae bacterium]